MGALKKYRKFMLFLAIGFMQGPAVKEIFQAAFPKKQVSIHKDLFGNDRMIVVE